MNKVELTILVEKYLDGELSVQDKKQFEKNLQFDKELAQELKLHKAIRSSIANKEIADLKEKLNEIKLETHRKAAISRRNNRRLVYALSIVILVIASSTFFYYNKGYTNDELFAEYYVFNSAGVITRGANDNVEDLTRGLIEYDLHNYKNATEILQEVLIKDSLNIAARYYLGLTYIETGKYDLAISCLESLNSYNNHILIDQIKWHLALCYIKVNDIGKAIIALKELTNSDYYCKNKAKEILKQLQ